MLNTFLWITIMFQLQFQRNCSLMYIMIGLDYNLAQERQKALILTNDD